MLDLNPRRGEEDVKADLGAMFPVGTDIEKIRTEMRAVKAKCWLDPSNMALGCTISTGGIFSLVSTNWNIGFYFSQSGRLERIRVTKSLVGP